MTALSGVRSSWLMLARKALLAWLAVSAASLAVAHLALGALALLDLALAAAGWPRAAGWCASRRASRARRGRRAATPRPPCAR